MSDVLDKFDSLASTYREHDYAAPDVYFARKAALIADHRPRLEPGDTVLDLGCGDGALAAPLLERGLAYHGVDASPGMVAAAKRRQPGAEFELGSFDDYEPAQQYDAVVAMRSFYYAKDRPAFFAKAHRVARKKFVFDFDPRVHSRKELVADLRAAGFTRIRARRYLLPQRRALPLAVQRVLWAVEATPLGALAVWMGMPPRCLVTAEP